MKIGIAVFVFLICDTAETSGALKKSNYCDSNWEVHNGLCYYDYLAYGTLISVQTQCERLFSKIIKVQSAEQLKFIQRFRIDELEVWVDLYRRTEGDSPGWYWGDGTPFVPTYLKWNKGLESAYKFSHFALTTQGTLIPLPHVNNNGYICEVKPNGKKCPKDYQLSGGTCFFLSNLFDVTSLTNSLWGAKDKCNRKANGSKLLEIQNREKMRAVNALITVKSSVSWCIGLTKYANNWKWFSDASDASSVKRASYIKWANENDNLGGTENCAVMFLRTGRLMDVECRSTSSYGICTKPDTIPMFSPFTGKFGCGNTGWVRGGTSCYLVPEKVYDWDKGRAVCRKSGGDIVKIVSSTEATWMMNLMPYKNAWTGLCYKNGAWLWTDGEIFDHQAIKWETEPKTLRYEEPSCAVVNMKGQFVAKSCNVNYRYVCELREADESKCPDNWKYFNRSCYLMVSNNRTTWRDARYHCRALAGKDHYGYLFYPSYIHEIDFVVKTLLPKVTRSQQEGNSPLYIWTILTDDGTGVWGYAYSKHQPIDIRHINWRKSPRKEATKTNGSYCAAFHRGFLVDHPRKVTLTTLCKRPLGVESKKAEQVDEASLLTPWWWIVASCLVMATRWAH